METVPVSVVIPCYGHANVIARAIASVANQSVRPLEVIVVNDGAGDECGKAISELQRYYGNSWLSVLTLPSNVGAGEARNAGWDRATGDYVAFLDADDAWHPRKLEIQYTYMRTHLGVAVSGHRHRRQKSGEVSWDNCDVSGSDLEVSFARLLLANQFITPSAMVRRDLELRFAVRQRYMEDFRLWLSVAAEGHRIVKLNAELACTFKAIYGDSGLSAELVSMEVGELRTYWAVCINKPLLLPLILALVPYSLIKCVRRYLVSWSRALNGRRSSS
jgi:glycosyltransferase involved in cell wall biosynthesis